MFYVISFFNIVINVQILNVLDASITTFMMQIQIHVNITAVYTRFIIKANIFVSFVEKMIILLQEIVLVSAKTDILLIL